MIDRLFDFLEDFIAPVIFLVVTFVGVTWPYLPYERWIAAITG